MRAGRVLAFLVAPLLLLLPLAEAPRAQESYRAGLERWRAEREADLRAEDGWLSVVGLAWLRPGVNPAGRDPAAAVRLPAPAPARLGVFHLEGTTVRFEPIDPGVRVNGAPAKAGVIRSDLERPVDVITAGTLSLTVIRRGDRAGVRAKDRASEKRRAYPALKWYPARETWRVTARFVPHAPPRTIKIANVLGQLDDQPSPGYVVFTAGGREQRLDALAGSSGGLFFILRDGTSGKTTYPAGRFLYTDAPRDGRVVLDFNKAENPPCAYTEFATCPLPPKQNWLRVAIEAGEQYTEH